ncbi:hypothetical protein OUZ56_003381 [Daphnia magna]|uniref:Uncharacterized protein n=1 Tax=Daphnia magna TaxID=35525 RepID=A0ABR0A8K4_9CRUS|nr:hypothetical protein OUZ56_003381 [Daphnia magna]
MFEQFHFPPPDELANVRSCQFDEIQTKMDVVEETGGLIREPIITICELSDYAQGLDEKDKRQYKDVQAKKAMEGPAISVATLVFYYSVSRKYVNMGDSNVDMGIMEMCGLLDTFPLAAREIRVLDLDETTVYKINAFMKTVFALNTINAYKL